MIWTTRLLPALSRMVSTSPPKLWRVAWPVALGASLLIATEPSVADAVLGNAPALTVAAQGALASLARPVWSLLDAAAMLLLALQAAAASLVGPIWAMWLVAGLLIGGMVAAQAVLLWSVWRRDAV